jgi:adenylate cyclase
MNQFFLTFFTKRDYPMTISGFKRKLTAIFSTDVKGYSRLMSEDEEDTVRTLTAFRELITGLIQEHRGRVVDSPGDNLLAEFPSVVDAVHCAAEIQQVLGGKNAALSENRRMEFRIGINLGDVIEDGDRIYGDGVNIAARLEELAQPGGICISGSAHEQIENKLPLEFEYLGEQAVKNITKPLRVYRVITKPEAGTLELSREVQLTDRASIAVLPFTNMSGDPEQEYFSDGITEDIITDLSNVSGLFVIARNSVFTYKGRAVKIEDVGKELGVRYVLEGSVRKANERVRITAQLVDATTGGHLWSERYDRKLEDIFALQDEVTQKIVSVLAVKLTEDEQIRRVCKYNPPFNVESYDYYLRGLEYLFRFTQEANVQAREMLERSIDLEPHYALAHSRLGESYLNEWIFGWSQDPQTVERAYDLAKGAIALEESLSEAHSLLGNVYLWKGQHELAIAELQKALTSDPNNADGLATLGSILSWAGRPDEGLRMIKKAMRFNPIYPVYYLWILGHAYFLMDEHEEAIAAFKRALNLNPNFYPTHFYLAASYSDLGREEEARDEFAELQRKWPRGSLESAKQRLPYKHNAILERLFEALRKAGLPE